MTEADEGTQVTGRVARLVNLADKPPFGFIKPSDGGADLYFNERVLGSGQSWEAFAEIVSMSEPGTAPVMFVKSEYSGRPQAKGVIALTDEQVKEADADADGDITAEEMEEYLKAHPELQESSLTKREREYKRSQQKYEQEQNENEEESKARDELFQRQDAAEDALYKKRDEENAEAKRLRDEAQPLWDAGDKEACKEMQAEAKKHQELARQYKQQAVDLDWTNNEEMFEYVQTKEHEGRERDGTWIDLHGLSVDFAEHKTHEALESAQENSVSSLEIITGAGNHSGKGGPKVKVRIHEMLNEKELKFEEATAGSVTVTLA